MVGHPASHDIYYDLLMKFKKIFVKGGPKRMKYTVPALVFALIKLSQDIYYGYFSHDALIEETKDADEDEPLVHKVTQKKIYADIAALIQLVTPHQQELAFRLNLQAVLSLNVIQ